MAGRSGMGLEIEICTTEQSKGGRRGGGRRGGAVSIQLLPCEKRRGSDGLGQCCCVPALHSVGTETPLSDANELSVTSFSLLQMSICLQRVDSGETVSRDVTGMVILLI